MGEITLLNMDCLDYMREQPDKSFDLCVTSPPYNINLRTNRSLDGYMARTEEFCITKKYKNNNDSMPMDDYFDFLNSIVSELIRTTKLVFFNIQMVTGNKPALFRMLGAHAGKIKELIIWDKCSGQPAMANNVLNSRFELIVVFSDNSITRQFEKTAFNRGELDNLWQIKRQRSDDISHGATFPRLLVDKILINFSKSGDRVLDPFLGTGTSAIAAHYFGVDFVGCEIDEDYYKAAVKRFDNETAQQALAL